MFDAPALQAAWFVPHLTQLFHSPSAALLPVVPLLSFFTAGAALTGLERSEPVARVGLSPTVRRKSEPNVVAAVAISEDEHKLSQDLVGERYSWRGYDVAGTQVDACGDQRELTLIAWADRDAVGTMTLGVDGGAGLRADEGYRDLLNQMRTEGRTVCEFTRFAVAPEADTKATLTGLFDLAYVLGRKMLGVTDAVIEVNPRHLAFYRRVFGFRTASDVRTCERVNAPAVLLHLDVQAMEDRMAMVGARTPGELAMARG